MRTDPDNCPPGRVAGTTYDEIYVDAWKAALQQCEKNLERRDHERSLAIKSREDFRVELEKLQIEYDSELPRQAFMLLHPTLDHYDTFAKTFVQMMSQEVEVSMMWGLLFLVFRLALEAPGALQRIIRMLEKICHELRVMNDCSEVIRDFGKVKGDAVEVNREIVILWLNIIMVFRTETHTESLYSYDSTQEKEVTASAWDSIQSAYKEAYQNIDEAVKRVERVAEMAKRQAHMVDMAMFQKLLSLQESKQQEARLPCNTLPVAKNRKFFGRTDILDSIEAALQPANLDAELSAAAVYGLGGIGKTQVATAYAYSKLDELDAVFWIPAENEVVLQQAFTRAAVNALRLPNASPHQHYENMVLVLDWLQKTSAKWLLVFDNVENHQIFENCWPVAKHGAILVTSRNPNIAMQPIDVGLEIEEFSPDEGGRFLLHLIPNHNQTQAENDAAQEVSKKLGGHPLAISQMAAVISARHMTVQDFLGLYDKYQQRLHHERKPGWKAIGYEHSLDTVWVLSFESLDEQATTYLGILSFVSPDSVPKELFELSNTADVPASLAFLKDDYSRGDALEQLTSRALVKPGREHGSLSLHRLVQAEYRARVASPQEKFESSTRLLLEKFPDRAAPRTDDVWTTIERYLPHVVSLMDNYNKSQNESEPLKPNAEFIKLMTNVAWAVHDNDTANVLSPLVDTGVSAYWKSEESSRDVLAYAVLLAISCLRYLTTTEFEKAESDTLVCLGIRLAKLPMNSVELEIAYSYLGLSTGSQGKYIVAGDWLDKAGEILKGPAGDAPTRKLTWNMNRARNYYCAGQYAEAEGLLQEAMSEADGLDSWYFQIYAHLAYASLRTRMKDYEVAQKHVEITQQVLERSGGTAKTSWLSASVAHRAAFVALLQKRTERAIEQAEKAVATSKLVRVPTAQLARSLHVYSRALALDPTRQNDAEEQRKEARRVRKTLPGGGGDLDNESDEAFDLLVKIDQR